MQARNEEQPHLPNQIVGIVQYCCYNKPHFLLLNPTNLGLEVPGTDKGKNVCFYSMFKNPQISVFTALDVTFAGSILQMKYLETLRLRPPKVLWFKTVIPNSG